MTSASGFCFSPSTIIKVKLPKDSKQLRRVGEKLQLPTVLPIYPGFGQKVDRDGGRGVVWDRERVRGLGQGGVSAEHLGTVTTAFSSLQTVEILDFTGME